MTTDAERYRLLIQQLPDAFAYHQIVADDRGIPVDYVFLEVNAAFEKMTGLKRESVLNRRVTEVWPGIKDDEHDWIGFYGQVARGGKSPGIEQYLESLQRWYQVQVYRDEPGYLIITFHDITHQKQEAASVKGMYQALVDNIPGLTFRCQLDRDWTMLYMNYAVDSLTGYPSSDFVHNSVRTYESVIHPDDTDFVSRSVNAAVAAGQPWDIEYRVCHKDGSIRWAHEKGRGVPGEDGQVAFLDGLVLDITERKQAEEALKESSRKLDIFFSQSFSGFFFMMLDEPIAWNEAADKEALLDYAMAHQRMTRVNQALLDQYGARVEDFLGLTPGDLFAHDPEHGRHIWRGLFDQGRWHVETQERRLDGTPIIVDGDYICLYDDQGRITGHFGVQADITERKGDEKRLRESEERLTAFISQTPAIIYAYTVTDGIPEITYISDNVINVLGFQPDAFINDISLWFGCVHPDDQESLKEKLEGRETQHEYRFKDSLGAYRWLADQQRVVARGKGRVNIVGAWWDITERRQAEESLLASKEQYRIMSENAPVGLFQSRISSSGVFGFTHISDKITEITGIPAADVLENYTVLHDRIHPNYQQCFNQAMEISVRELTDFLQKFLFRKDGMDIWLEVRATPRQLKDGSIVWDGVFIDIDQTKRAEEALAKERGRLINIIEGTNAGTWECNLQTGETFLNEKWAEVLGYTLEELSPITIDTWLGRLHPDDFDPAQSVLNRHISGELDYYDTESRMKHKDGSWCWVHGKGKIISWTVEGKPLWMFGTHVDITDRKQAEEALLASEKQLAAKNKELEQLVYIASHDLRSPLVNVDGFSRELEYSLQEIGGVLDGDGLDHAKLERTLPEELPDMKKSLQHIRTSARQMDVLLKGLLRLSRSSQAVLQIASIDMNDLAGQVASSFAFRLQEDGIELVVEDLPACRGDAMQLSQVFSNLLDNAIKYLDEDRPGKIRVQGQVESGRAVYRVEDNGMGIADNQRERVFELFNRLQPDHGEGEGLGLTLVRQILDRMDGEIAVESQAGAGSTFIVTLPRAAGETHE